MIRISGLFILIGLMSCSPKPADIKQQDTATPVIKDTVKQTSNPDCPAFADLSGYDRERVETAYILYRDYLKAGKYTDALVHWRIAYGIAPGSNGRVKYQFSDGAAIYKYLYDQEADENLKKKYVDTVMMIYDKQITCFGDTALVNGLKAFDLYYYYPEYADENMLILFSKQ